MAIETTRYIDDGAELSDALRRALEAGDYLADPLMDEFRAVQQDERPARGWRVDASGSTHWLA